MGQCTVFLPYSLMKFWCWCQYLGGALPLNHPSVCHCQGASVGWALDHCAGGHESNPWPDQHSGSLNNWEDAAFIISFTKWMVTSLHGDIAWDKHLIWLTHVLKQQHGLQEWHPVEQSSSPDQQTYDTENTGLHNKTHEISKTRWWNTCTVIVLSLTWL